MTLEANLQTQRTLEYRRSQRLSMRTGGVVGNWVASGQNATGTMVAGRLYATPLYLPDTCRVSALIISVTTGSAGNARIGLYTDSGGYPSTRLFVATEITTMGTASLKRQAVNLTLPHGFYWAVIVMDSTPILAEDSNSTGVITHWLGGDSGTDLIGHSGIIVTFDYAALPDPFTAGGTYTTTVQPRIQAQIGKYGKLD